MSSRWLAGVVALALSGCVVIDASDSGGRPDPVRVGQPLTYTIAVEAISADTGVVLTDMPPAEAAPVSASASQGTCSGAAPVVCNLGALATPAPITPPLDPVATGVRFLVRTRAGGVVVDADIAPGRFDPRARVGWKVDRRVRPTRWTHVDRSASPAGGIVRLQIRDRSSRTPGLVGLVLRARKRSYPVSSTDPSLDAELVLNPTQAQCGRAVFLAPSCRFSSRASVLECR